MWAENKVISVPCLTEEEGPEGLWSSLFMDSALGNVEALLKIWEEKFGSKRCRFGSRSQAVTAEMQKSLHLCMDRGAAHRGFAQGPTLPVLPNLCPPLGPALLPALPAAAGMGKGQDLISSSSLVRSG